MAFPSPSISRTWETQAESHYVDLEHNLNIFIVYIHLLCTSFGKRIYKMSKCGCLSFLPTWQSLGINEWSFYPPFSASPVPAGPSWRQDEQHGCHQYYLTQQACSNFSELFPPPGHITQRAIQWSYGAFGSESKYWVSGLMSKPRENLQTIPTTYS